MVAVSLAQASISDNRWRCVRMVAVADEYLAARHHHTRPTVSNSDSKLMVAIPSSSPVVVNIKHYNCSSAMRVLSFSLYVEELRIGPVWWMLIVASLIRYFAVIRFISHCSLTPITYSYYAADTVVDVIEFD